MLKIQKKQLWLYIDTEQKRYGWVPIGLAPIFTNWIAYDQLLEEPGRLVLICNGKPKMSIGVN